jgi:hypothetical protein
MSSYSSSDGLIGRFHHPFTHKLYPFVEEIYVYNAFFETYFQKQKQTLVKMYKTNSDAHLNFFMHCKKYFRLKSF